MKHPCLGALFLSLASLGTAAPLFGYGPNLLSNPGFDSSTAGWDLTGPGTLSWSTADRSGSPHSGSAKVVVGGSQPVQLLASPCIPLSSGGNYVLTGDVRIEGADGADRVGLGLQFFTDAACAVRAHGGFSLLDLSTPGWQKAAGGLLAASPGTIQAMRVMLSAEDEGPGGSFTVYLDDVALRTGICAPLRETLCLDDGRFAVSATWKLADGTEGSGQAVPFTDDSGSFWFFSPTNLELNVKVLDGCALNNRYWVFAAGMTNVDVTLYVSDTETGETKTYRNLLGGTFRTITDTAAFATCP